MVKDSQRFYHTWDQETCSEVKEPVHKEMVLGKAITNPWMIPTFQPTTTINLSQQIQRLWLNKVNINKPLTRLQADSLDQVKRKTQLGEMEVPEEKITTGKV